MKKKGRQTTSNRTQEKKKVWGKEKKNVFHIHCTVRGRAAGKMRFNTNENITKEFTDVVRERGDESDLNKKFIVL
jgi:hypothetical protein